MAEIYLHNTLSLRKEIFKSIDNKSVGLYTCGPTVYNYAHIGNLRTYIFEDFLKRVLLYNGYKVNHIMNITDVGHLTGDMDMGEDKMESGAKREGKSAYEIADFYTNFFKSDLDKLNIIFPSAWCKATDNIQEQIDLIKILEEKGYTYQTKDGIYFDTKKIDNYNKLSHLPLDELKEGARVEKNPEKKNPTDFALWKFSPLDSKRQMEWKSPWGIGFPGWHIECSAMSLKYLKKNLDIHCGGIDHINIHHTNEIAQSEAATGNKFFNYWLHGAFLNVSGDKKMAKSEENFLTLDKATTKKSIDPLAYRFATSQVHYRKPMIYSEESLIQAQNALDGFRSQVGALGEKMGKVDLVYREKFLKEINNDLNIPRAVAVLANMLKSNLSDEIKLATALDFDNVLGFDLNKKKIQLEVIKFWDKEIDNTPFIISDKVKNLINKREKARLSKDWSVSDTLRQEIKEAGFLVEDFPEGQKIIVENNEENK